jgi:ubiquinone/menaquinone biosynthesis C-methylase UbiE
VTRSYQPAFAESFRELDPKKILDLGTGIGKSITPFRMTYPDAEIWAVDLSPDFLRWAQFKAEHNQQRIAFVQQNAEDLFRFQDGEFDLVVADILFHEIPPHARVNVIREAHRVLRKGGQFVIADIEPEKVNTPYQRFITEWQRMHNGEPYWSTHLGTDYVQLMKEAGFGDAKEFGFIEMVGGRKFPWIRLATK